MGSADLTAALTVPLILVINNDALGETVDISSEGTDGGADEVGDHPTGRVLDSGADRD
jgi:hypothetical protein